MLSEAIAGDEYIATERVATAHFFVPSALIAYRLWSLDPIYTVSSVPTAGQETTWSPVGFESFGKLAVYSLSSDCVADGVQDIDEVARRRHTAEQLDLRKHLHLVARYVMNTPQVIVLPEVIPSRISHRLNLGTQ